MEFGLRGKVAFVAGSSRGLGRAIAEELAAEGAAVALCARSETALADVRSAIEGNARVRVSVIAADLSRGDEARRAVETAIADHGRLDVLVTNTGGPPPGPFDRHDPAAWQSAAQLLLTSAVELIRAALPGMRSRRFGRILNVTSIAVKQPVDNLILSNALRAAVTGMARTLANEVAKDGITVNNLMPGYTRTQRVVDLAQATGRSEGIAPEEVVARWEAQIPMGRLGEPRELAALAAFLASDRAGYITGQSIAVDGGWIRGLL